MGPITYSLCHKEVIGVAMWITGLCSFPPLIPKTEVSIREPGLVLSKEFNVPVDKSYLLDLKFIFPSTEARLQDEIVGDGRSSNYCSGEVEYGVIPENERIGLGRPIPFKVIVRKLDDSAQVIEKTFHSLCKTSHMTNDKGRDVGRLNLKEGGYKIEVYNLLPQTAFGNIKVQMGLVSGEPK